MKPTSRLLRPVALSLFLADAAAARTFDVTEFGATADGKTPCTAALQKAIDLAGAAGGAIVRLPPGVYLTGALELRSGVTLQIDDGATLLGSRELKDYQRGDASSSFRNLLHGVGLCDVTIRGAGTIDGNGDAFRDDTKRRPKNIHLEGCTNVVVEGVRLRSSGSWMQDYKLCAGVKIRGIDVFNHATFNNDGLDIDSSRDVVISDCVIDSDDDGLCLKSTTGTPCRNVRITGCTISSHCNQLKMGTESGGGFIDVAIRDCTVFSPRHTKKIYGDQRGLAGIALEIVDGGTLDNVTVSDVRIAGVLAPLFMRLGDRGRPYATGERPGVGTFRNVRITDVTATNVSALGCVLTGLPGHPLENVVLERIRLDFDGGGTRSNALRQIEEKPAAYPECKMFGQLPAYGFFCRHVAGLRLTDVELTTAAPDLRHAVVLDDAADVLFNRLAATAAPGTAPLIKCVQSRDVVIRGFAAKAPVDTLLQLEGDRTRAILLTRSDLGSVKQPVLLSPDVPAGAFTREP